jgi:hypothetical protein
VQVIIFGIDRNTGWSLKKTPAFFYVTDLLPESSQQAATGVP